jgi:hypothetical protein
MLGGGGCAVSMSWNELSAEIPVYHDVPCLTRWSFPYAIPFYEDPNHAGPLSYRTKAVLTNFDSSDAAATVTFHVADLYSLSGRTYGFTVLLPARSSQFIDLYALLAGYPASTSGEGWIEVTTPLGSRLAPFLMVVNAGMDRFSASVEPWEYRTLIR